MLDATLAAWAAAFLAFSWARRVTPPGEPLFGRGPGAVAAALCLVAMGLSMASIIVMFAAR